MVSKSGHHYCIRSDGYFTRTAGRVSREVSLSCEKLYYAAKKILKMQKLLLA
jgi:hypothetical protein